MFLYHVCDKYGIVPIGLSLDDAKNRVRKKNYRFRERNKESDGIIILMLSEPKR